MRLLARAAGLGTTATVLVAAAGIAPAQASTTPPTTSVTRNYPAADHKIMPPMPGVRWDCGVVTCSVYIGRGYTHTIQAALSRYANASALTIATAAGTACAATGVGGIFSPLCAGAGGIYGAIVVDQFNYASSHNMCVRIRFSAAPLPPVAAMPVVTGIYTDKSGFCGV